MQSHLDSPQIVTCLCSRGFINSRTSESVHKNLVGVYPISYEVLYTHDLPIPEAQNDVLKRALAMKPEWIWFVEEDIIVPNDGLLTMLNELHEQKAAVVSARYNLDGGSPAFKTHVGELVFSGLGCLLIKSSVFERLNTPYFETIHEYSCTEGKLYISGPQSQETVYGKQDIDFFYKLQKAGVKSVLSSVRVSHIKLKKWGAVNTNNGCHLFSEL